MSPHSTAMPSENVEWSVDHGISLALDPNLINLPLNSAQLASKNEESAANDDKMDLDEPEEAHSEHNSSTPKNFPSMVKNPYEMYGQMPLTQLIPLILQQKKIPFSQLSEEDMQQSTSMGHENESATNNNVAAGMDVSSVPQPITLPDIENEEPTIATTSVNEIATATHVPSTISTQAFNKIRSEMLEQTNIALNESSLALETVSLLLSATRENIAKSSMSPFLKRAVPVGSLNSDIIPAEQSAATTERSQNLIFGIGWKLKCLDESRNILRDAVVSIRHDLAREHVFWKKIGKYIGNTDVVFKMRDKATGLRTLGVKYGYEDSGSTFKHDKGIAILRNSPEDNNILELIPVSKLGAEARGSSPSNRTDSRPVETYIRVRILTKIESEDDYILSGESSFINLNEIAKEMASDAANDTDNDNIRLQIQKLKDIIFEKELMYQLKKECSQLLSYGVKIENENKVVVELPNEQFEIEMIYRDELQIANHEQDAPKINDKRANLFLVLLRMLLIVHFKKNLRKRLTTTTTTTHNQRATSSHILLIRPLLGKLRHQNYKILLKMIIKDNMLDILTGSTMREEKVTAGQDKPNNNSNNSREMHDRHIAKLDREIEIFEPLLSTPMTQFCVESAAGDRVVIILELRNYCNARVTIRYTHPANSKVSFDAEFAEFKEVEEFLHFIVTEYMQREPVEAPAQGAVGVKQEEQVAAAEAAPQQEQADDPMGAVKDGQAMNDDLFGDI